VPFVLWAQAVGAQEARSPLAGRLDDVRHMMSGTPPHDYGEVFAPTFLEHVQPVILAALVKEYFDKSGPVRTVMNVKADTTSGEFRFFGDRMVYPVKVAIDSSPPYLVTGFWLGTPAPLLGSIDEATRKLRELPGEVAFALWKLDDAGPKPLSAVNADRPLAIGSAFKLYVLGALIDDVVHGARSWNDVLALEQRVMSWPTGVLHEWPVGTPLTLASLAAEMISISDNTATDHLISGLGRERVERMLDVMGNTNGAKNRPFLTTREMFLLKSTDTAAAARRALYAKADATKRRKQLDKEIASLPREAFHGLDMSKPVAIDAIEWFASAGDLCRAMTWIKSNTESTTSALGRRLLTVNRGLTWTDALWDFVGYKGGSEPGVLSLTWLLKRKDGAWYVLSAGWNDRKSTLDEQRFFELLQGVILLLERGAANQ
jgi:hypothetical protein